MTSSSSTPEVLAAVAAHTGYRAAGALWQRINQLGVESLDAVADIAGGPLNAELMPLVRDDVR